MKPPNNLFFFSASILPILICFPKTVYAYLDPGSGSFILQMLIAGLLGVLFSIKMMWGRIKEFFNNLFSKQ